MTDFACPHCNHIVELVERPDYFDPKRNIQYGSGSAFACRTHGRVSLWWKNVDSLDEQELMLHEKASRDKKTHSSAKKPKTQTPFRQDAPRPKPVAHKLLRTERA
jgi:hypothetical protein